MPVPDNKPFTGKIYSYLRFSTPEQQLGDSERRQLDLAQKFAADLGTTLDETLIDRGLSGYHGVHKSKGHLGRFLERVEKGEIPTDSILVIENIDRLSREPTVDAFITFSGLLKSGVNIQTLCPMQLYDLDALNGGLIHQLVGQMLRAHGESQHKSERVRAARENARRLARQEGKIITSRCPAWLRVSPQRTFEIIPEAAVAVQRIYDLKLQGIGYNSIAKALNTEPGWKASRSSGWHAGYISKIIQNRAVIGEYQPYQRIDGKRLPAGDPIAGYYPPIVDVNIFYAVQEQLKAFQGKGGRTGKAKNLFPHLVKCAYCGGPMAYADKGPPPYGGQILICDNARRRFKCDAHRMRYDEAEALILANCQGLRPDQVLPDPDSQTQQIQALNLKLQGVAGSLVDIESQIDQLVGRVAQAPSESLVARYEKRITELEEQQAQLTEQQKQLAAELKQLQRSAKSFTKWKRDFKQLLKSLDNVEIRLKLRLHLKGLIDRIEVFPVGFKERYDRSKDTSLDAPDDKSGKTPDPVTIPESFVNTEITGNLLRETMVEVVVEEKPKGMQIEDLDAMVDYVESQCMSKRGRFCRVFFHSGSWIDLVPEGSLARGWKLIKNKWQLVEGDFKPLLAEFVKSRKQSPVGS
jgi:DNA invertase Pin-like site-specific DNA recombinase